MDIRKVLDVFAATHDHILLRRRDTGPQVEACLLSCFYEGISVPPVNEVTTDSRHRIVFPGIRESEQRLPLERRVIL
jgi:hypothetical protein